MPAEVKNDGLEPQYFQSLLENLHLTPLYREQGILPLVLGKGYTVFTISGSKTVFNSSGVIHGGVQMTCADTAMGSAIRASGIKTSTIQQTSCFLAPCPMTAQIICTGRIVKSGRNMFFCQAEITADDKPVSTFEAVFANLGPETITRPFIPE